MTFGTTLVKLLKTNAAVWFNKLCKIKQLKPKYININISSIFKSFNINNLSVCIGWCTDQVIWHLCWRREMHAGIWWVKLRPRHKWQNNIKMDLQKIVREGVD